MIRGAHKSITGRSPSPPTSPQGLLPAVGRPSSRPASQQSARMSPPATTARNSMSARPIKQQPASMPASPRGTWRNGVQGAAKPAKSKPVPVLVPLRPAQRHGPATPSTTRILRPIQARRPASSVRVGPSAIDRALGGLLPEASIVDLESLHRAEDSYRVLRMQTHGPSALGRSGAQTARGVQRAADFMATSNGINGGGSSARRGALKEQGVELSKLYNKLGMDCLRDSPRLSLECLQRALLVSPKEHPSQATTMCNMGAYHLHMSAPAVAIRYLLRAVQSDYNATPEVRGRVRLNLSVAYGMESQHFEALECAQEASTLLESAMEGMQEGGASGAAIRAVQVLRAVALHNCCASHEFLHQYSTARIEARKAYRLASEVLPADDGLVRRLQSVEISVEQKVRDTLPSRL